MVSWDDISLVFTGSRQIKVLPGETLSLDSQVELRLLLAFLEISSNYVVARAWYFESTHNVLSNRISNRVLALHIVRPRPARVHWAVRVRPDVYRSLSLLDVRVARPRRGLLVKVSQHKAGY